jgi:hypothetical protein
VRGKQNGALLADLFDVLDDFGLLVRVEIAGRLVEDEDRRVVQERLTQTDALPVAVRERVDVFSEHLGEAAHLDHLLHARLERG